MAHWRSTAVLFVVHTVLTAMLGAALGAYDTALWLVLTLRCQLATQPAVGAVDAEVCSRILQTGNQYLLAFMVSAVQEGGGRTLHNLLLKSRIILEVRPLLGSRFILSFAPAQ